MSANTKELKERLKNLKSQKEIAKQSGDDRMVEACKEAEKRLIKQLNN